MGKVFTCFHLLDSSVQTEYVQVVLLISASLDPIHGMFAWTTAFGKVAQIDVLQSKVLNMTVMSTKPINPSAIKNLSFALQLIQSMDVRIQLFQWKFVTKKRTFTVRRVIHVSQLVKYFKFTCM